MKKTRSFWDDDKGLIKALNAGFEKVARAIREKKDGGIKEEDLLPVLHDVTAILTRLGTIDEGVEERGENQ